MASDLTSDEASQMEAFVRKMERSYRKQQGLSYGGERCAAKADESVARKRIQRLLDGALSDIDIKITYELSSKGEKVVSNLL